MTKLHFLILIASAAVYLACQPVIDRQAEKAALLNADREFAAASVEHGAAEAFNMYLDENAMQMPSGSEPITGRQKIYEGMIGEYSLEWEPQDGEAAKSGDLGWTWGKSKFTYINDAGDSVSVYGKYLNVWKKQADGSWKVLVDIGNKSPAPEEN